MSLSEMPPSPQRGRGRPGTDPAVIERFHCLLDWGIGTSRAAQLCKPKTRGRPKAKPEALGRALVVRLQAERADRTPVAVPEGFTPETLKALSDDALRALLVHGPKSRQFRTALVPKPEKPALSIEEKREKRAAKQAAEAREAEFAASYAHYKAGLKSGRFHYTPPPLARRPDLMDTEEFEALAGIKWPRMPSPEEAQRRMLETLESERLRGRPGRGKKVSEIPSGETKNPDESDT